MVSPSIARGDDSRTNGGIVCMGWLIFIGRRNCRPGPSRMRAVCLSCGSRWSIGRRAVGLRASLGDGALGRLHVALGLAGSQLWAGTLTEGGAWVDPASGAQTASRAVPSF